MPSFSVFFWGKSSFTFWRTSIIAFQGKKKYHFYRFIPITIISSKRDTKGHISVQFFWEDHLFRAAKLKSNYRLEGTKVRNVNKKLDQYRCICENSEWIEIFIYLPTYLFIYVYNFCVRMAKECIFYRLTLYD